MKNKIVHFFVFVFLSIITQIGGIVYIASLSIIGRNNRYYRLKRFFVFSLLYISTTFLLVPNLSYLSGRIKIEDNSELAAHSFITKLLNRNYVTIEMHQVLTEVSHKLNMKYPGTKVIYLDANFPFFNGFPLLPHLSHNDGKKLDISFIYEKPDNTLTNLKKSRSGYGVFVNPINKEYNQTNACKKEGYWQYDFPKYFTFGSINNQLNFSNKANDHLINSIAAHPRIQKIFIEPHLKKRLHLTSSKIRFHGCQSVRHDDHIHFQIR